jgi:hypothetical protein
MVVIVFSYVRINYFYKGYKGEEGLVYEVVTKELRPRCWA